MSVQPAAVLRAKMVTDFTQFETGAKATIRSAQGMADQVGRTGDRIRQSMAGGAKSFEELRASVDPTYAAMQKYAAVQQQLAGYVHSGEASQRAANLVLEQAARLYMGVEASALEAARAQREQALVATVAARQAAQDQAEQARSLALLTGNYQSLRASLDPLYGASKRYETAIETADAALKAKIITEGEHVRVLQLAQAQLQGITPAAGAAGAAAGKFGMVANQLGFQIQDFFVQLASGQSVMMAFAQQAPQAAGAFSMLGGRIGTIIPWIGTFVAIGAAVAPMLFNLGSGAKTAQDRIDDLNGTLDAAERYMDAALLPIGGLIAKYGNLAVTVRDANMAMSELKVAEALSEVDAAIAGTSGRFVSLLGSIDEIGKTGFQSLSILNTQFGIGGAQANRLNAALEAMRAAKGPADQARAAAELAAELRRSYSSVSAMPPEVQALYAALNSATIPAAELDRLMRIATGQTGDWAAAMTGVRLEVMGIASALSQLGGGMISNAAKFVEINALKAGKSVAAARIEVERFNMAAQYDGRIAAAEARGDAFGWVEAQALKAAKAMELSGIAASSEADSLRAAASAAERAAAGTGRAGAASSAAEKAAAKLTKELDREAERWLDVLDPVAKYKREMGDLLQLQGRLSDGQMAAALRQLNVQFADSLPLVGGLVDSLTDGLFNGFKGAMGNIGDMFKSWLAEMIATAAKNRIVMSMGMGVGMTGTAAASAAGTVAQAGAAGNALSGIGMLGSLGGIGTGLQAALGLGGFTSAGMFSVTANAAAAAATGVSGLAATIGAAIPVIGIAALGLAALFGKTKLLDSGIRVTVTEMDALVETFRKTEKSRLFGLVKSRSASFTLADAEIADPVRLAVGDIQGSVLDAARVLGIGSKAFDDFRTQIEVSTKGLSEEEAAKAVQEALGTLGDDFAGMIKGIDGLSRAGEGAMDTVLRLSGSLTVVQQVADTLGHAFRLVGLVGGDVASNLADAFGGLDAMAQATQAYFGAFYTEQERVAVITRQTTAQLAKMGLAMPQSRDEYRRMIESLDLSQKSSAELYATLIGLSGVMDQILPGVGSLTQQLAALTGAVQTDLDRMISAAAEAQSASAQAAADWYKAAGSIRDYIDRLRGTAGALVSAQAALGYNTARYQQMLLAATGGDLTATQGITTAAQTMLDSVRALSRNRVEMARAEARVLSDLGLVQGSGDIEGARHDVIAGLLGQQVDVLTQTRDALAAGGALSTAQIDALNAQLGGLESAIKAAEMINYQFLQQRLAVSVDLIASANVPADLRRLLANAATGVTGYVDFVTRSNLPADLKWLALTGASEHVKTVDYLAQNSMGVDLTRLALATTSVLQKTVTLAVGKQLPADVMRLALAGNSELSRVVTATLGTNIGTDAMRLALGNVGAYGVSVMAALSPAVSPAVRRMVIEQQGSYAAVIEAAIGQTMTGAARRILLTQQGQYIANVVGVLASDMPAATRKLLIEANTAAVRAVTVTAAFARSLTADERAALSAAAQSSFKTVRAMVDLSGLSASGSLFLAQIGLGEAAVQKSLIGRIALGTLSTDQRLLLTSVSGEVLRTIHLQATGRPTEDQWRLLTAVSASVLRRVDFAATGGLSADQRAILGTVSGSAQRLLQMVTQGALTNDQRTILAATAASLAYGLRLTTAGRLTEDQRRVLLAQAGLTARALSLATTGGLTVDQRTILGAAGGQFARALLLSARGALTEDQRAILAQSSGTVGRMLALTVSGWLTADQRAVLGAAPGRVDRTVAIRAIWGELSEAQRRVLQSAGGAYCATVGAVWGVMNARQARVLQESGGGYQARISAAWATLTAEQQRVLWAQSGQYLAAIRATGVLTEDQRAMLAARDGTARRALALLAAGVLTPDQRAMLAETGGAARKDLALSASGLLTQDQRAILAAADARASKLLALVATGGITAEQLQILQAVDARAVKLFAISGAGALTADQRLVATALPGSVERKLVGTMWSKGLTPLDLGMLDQLGGDAWRSVDRKVVSTMWSKGLVGLDLEMLALLSGGDWRSVERRLVGSMVSGGIIGVNAQMLDQLGGGSQRSVDRKVIGTMWSKGLAGLDLAMLAQLSGGDWRSVERKLVGTMWSKGLTGLDHSLLDQLGQGAGSIIRTLIGKAEVKPMTDDALKILRATTATITRTINGEIKLGALTDSQKALLAAINGQTRGTITLGGSFVFDPAAGFKTWYAQATAGAITVPMTQLQITMGILGASLADLRAAVLAETARATRADQLARLNAYAGSLTTNGAGSAFVADDDLAAMARIVGLDPKAGADVLRRSLVGWDAGDLLKGTVYDPTGAKEAAYLDRINKPVQPEAVRYALDDYRLEPSTAGGGSGGNVTGYWITGPLGGRRLVNATSQNAAEAWLRAQQFPAFARGGTHKGGPAYIGENDLELVAPSRVYSPSETRDMLDNRQVVAELRALRQELAATRAENTQLLLRIEGHDRQVARTLRDWDINGQPAERTA